MRGHVSNCTHFTEKKKKQGCQRKKKPKVKKVHKNKYSDERRKHHVQGAVRLHG